MDERFHEMAARLEQEQREEAIHQAQAAMSGSGSPYCEDCDEQIPPERRQAHPAAQRCIHCQNTFELLSKGHAR